LSDQTRHAVIHTSERRFTCESCDKRFTQSSTLYRHKLIHFKQRYASTKEKHVKQTLQCLVYVCSQCHLLFINRLLI